MRIKLFIDYKECKDLIGTLFSKSSVEFITGRECQNACKYCYRAKHQNTKHNPVVDFPVDRMLMFYENAVEMGLLDKHLNSIELFGGDPIVDLPYLSEVFSTFSDKTDTFVLPTNFRIIENIKDSDVDDLLKCAHPARVAFSISYDGPVEEYNRPLSKFGYNQGFSNERNVKEIFRKGHKYRCGFHPMFYFDTVEHWFRTYKFFYDNDVLPYLLEVRHPIPEKEKIIEGVVQYGAIVKDLTEKNIDLHKLNSTAPSHVPRGLGCSALVTMPITPDGYSYFCHRLMFEEFKDIDFTTKKINPRVFDMNHRMFDFKNSPICMNCPIKNYCGQVCVGAVYEYWDGSITLPIPSLCEYYKLKCGYLATRSEQWNKCFTNSDLDYLERETGKLFGKNIYDVIDERVDALLESVKNENYRIID